jgi:hypothetical protein
LKVLVANGNRFLSFHLWPRRSNSLARTAS